MRRPDHIGKSGRTGCKRASLDLLLDAVHWRHVRLVACLLQLHFQTLGTNLKAVHRLNGGIRRPLIVIAHKTCEQRSTLHDCKHKSKRTETLAQARLLVDKDFRRQYVAERRECLYNFQYANNSKNTLLRTCASSESPNSCGRW